MAVVKSTAIGSARKSAGELTYRHTRGRTIASGRVRSNPSKTAKQIVQRQAFGFIGKLAKTFREQIKVGFPKTKYGTERNNFVQSNKLFIEGLKSEPVILKELTGFNTTIELCRWLDTEGFYETNTLILSSGMKPEVCEIGHYSNGNIDGTFTLSRPFSQGETLHFVCLLWISRNRVHSSRKVVKSYTLTAEDMNRMTDAHTLKLKHVGNGIFDGLVKIPADHELTANVACLFVSGDEGTTEGAFAPLVTLNDEDEGAI